jgi:hypothetical protein
MKIVIVTLIYSMLNCLCCEQALAKDLSKVSSPEAIQRTHRQNYHDMVLASCIERAYYSDDVAAKDAGSSVTALREWTLYDIAVSISEVDRLITSYLSRNYDNPIVDDEVKGVHFELLKCFDLYHSKSLQQLSKKTVVDPDGFYRPD